MVRDETDQAVLDDYGNWIEQTEALAVMKQREAAAAAHEAAKLTLAASRFRAAQRALEWVLGPAL